MVGQHRGGEQDSGEEGEGEDSGEEGGGESDYSTEDEGEGDGDGEEGEEGEGEEVDDDDDKKNPQYIPKKGMFYEHDDRYISYTL